MSRRVAGWARLYELAEGGASAHAHRSDLRGRAMADSVNRQLWARRLTWIGALLSFGAVAAALVAAIGSGQEWWHFRIGFAVLRYAFFSAIAGAATALVAAAVARRSGRSLRLVNLLALAVAIAFVAFVGNQLRIARSVPAIHDVSTDLDDPPSFRRLAVRADNLETIPAEGRPDLEALTPEARWKAIHREHYSDLAPIRVPWTVAQTVERARALAVARGWEIAAADPEAGTLEAVETSLFFRFKDDIAVRVRPDAGHGSIVDMRSISRVGVSDVGVNARRVRAFLAELQRG